MPLVQVADVKSILEVPSALTDSQIQGFINDADVIVQEVLANTGLSSSRLAVIEKWLAAHLTIQLTERGGLTDSQDGNSRDSYVNLGPRGQDHFFALKLTRYGQQALFFDTSGRLAAMGRPTAKLNLVGRTATRQWDNDNDADDVL